MEQKILETLGSHNMLPKGSKVIVALSGGADSMALFHFFVTHREELGIGLAAAHCNHGLRGKASDADAAFTARYCEEQGIPLYSRDFHMKGRQKPRGESEESWARTLRYAFFDELAAEHNALIATAHTLDDNAETVLFRAARGAGPRGLSGVPPVRGPYIRPLLGVRRAEVEAYCAAHALPFCTDATNEGDAYARNRLRHGLLPRLEEAHPGAAASLSRLAADMAGLDAYLRAQAAPLVIFAEDGTASAETAQLLAAPAPVRLQALAMMAGRDADRAALARLEALLQKPGGHGRQQLPGGKVALLRGGALTIQKDIPPPESQPFCHPFRAGVFLLPGGRRVEIRVESAQQVEKFKKKDLTFVADYDRILKCDSLRSRLPGDTFAPEGRGITKTLKKWLNEQGVPPEVRGDLPLLASGSRVLWVWGAGFCAGVAPTPGTHRFLILDTNEEGNEHGE